MRGHSRLEEEVIGKWQFYHLAIGDSTGLCSKTIYKDREYTDVKIHALSIDTSEIRDK